MFVAKQNAMDAQTLSHAKSMIKLHAMAACSHYVANVVNKGSYMSVSSLFAALVQIVCIAWPSILNCH